MLFSDFPRDYQVPHAFPYNLITATPWCLHGYGLGNFFRVRSPLLAESSFLYFPQGTEMFHFPCLPSFRMMEHELHRVSPFGHHADHSLLGSSPRLIAACYVLRRLNLPRHPPCTLSCLTNCYSRHLSNCYIVRRRFCVL